MPISFDTSTSGGNATATSLTFSHTTGTGVSRYLVVGAVTNEADSTDYFTGVTYAAVAMTRLGTFQSPGSGGLVCYGLANPTTGANNVVISLSGSKTVYGASSSFFGVRSAQPDAANSNASDPVSSLTVSVTTVINRAWLVSVAGKKAGSASVISASTNVTSRQVNTYIAIGDSNAAQTPPGSFGQTWALDVASGLAVITVSLAPASSGGFFSIF